MNGEEKSSSLFLYDGNYYETLEDCLPATLGNDNQPLLISEYESSQKSEGLMPDGKSVVKEILQWISDAECSQEEYDRLYDLQSEAALASDRVIQGWFRKAFQKPVRYYVLEREGDERRVVPLKREENE